VGLFLGLVVVLFEIIQSKAVTESSPNIGTVRSLQSAVTIWIIGLALALLPLALLAEITLSKGEFGNSLPRRLHSMTPALTGMTLAPFVLIITKCVFRRCE
jgi:hypothetical protein